MKKLYLLFTLLVIGFSAEAVPGPRGEAFIFVERGVEFAIYPDGQFDFLYRRLHRTSPHRNFSYNSGYDYGPYIQFDDFGAVIQIEQVPVYYDAYGRIVQAGSVRISYTHFGRLASVGHLYIYYDRYNRISHYSGYINTYNRRYVYRPWHRHFRRPHPRFAVVYHQPYRNYYHPDRMDFGHFKRYYRKNHRSFQRRYYEPGDRITSYHRGTRAAAPRTQGYSSNRESREIRSNHTTRRSSSSYTEKARRMTTREEGSEEIRRSNNRRVLSRGRSATRSTEVTRRSSRKNKVKGVERQRRSRGDSRGSRHSVRSEKNSSPKKVSPRASRGRN